MEDIYWRVFGTSIVTNNEVLLWIVQGYFAQTKNIEINWAKAAPSTVREKTRKDDVNNGCTIYVKKEKIDYATNTSGNMTHSQLLEGLKEESQIEDNGKREGVRAHSITRNTRGVEGRVGAPGLGLGRVTSLIHLLEPASNQPQSG